MKRGMIIDLHVHEELYSGCSRMSLEEAIASAKRHGLDGLCITDHDSMEIRAECPSDADFPVFVGVEMFTRQGDIVAFGLETLPRPNPDAREFVDFVKERGGFCFAAHPFRGGNGLGRHLGGLRNLHGVEVLNGANLEEENRKALAECRRLNLVPVGGSDAHTGRDVGRCATWFPGSIATERDLVEALKSGEGRPVFRGEDGKYRFAT
jgi:predicted metal-dependent phosphoesterase TrpH